MKPPCETISSSPMAATTLLYGSAPRKWCFSGLRMPVQGATRSHRLVRQSAIETELYPIAFRIVSVSLLFALRTERND